MAIRCEFHHLSFANWRYIEGVMEQVTVRCGANCPSSTSLIIALHSFYLHNYKWSNRAVIITPLRLDRYCAACGYSCYASGCGRCPLPAGTPSCQGQTCCPSSAWRGPVGGGRDTLLPTAKGYSWAPLSWQPFSTATGPLLHPVGGNERGAGFEGRAEERCEGG